MTSKRMLARLALKTTLGTQGLREVWRNRRGAGDPSGRHPGRGHLQQVRMSQTKTARAMWASRKHERSEGLGEWTLLRDRVRGWFRAMFEFVRRMFRRDVKEG